MCACFGAAVIASSPTAHAEVYRCTVDGRIVYSDRPCGSQSTKVEIESTRPPKPDQNQALQLEAGLGHVLVGMTPAQVETAWSRPREITSESDGKNTVERWAYDRSGEVVTVQFQAGKVSKITSVKGFAPAPLVTTDARLNQLTLSELEESERADKAGERRFARIGMTPEEVRGKLGPPSDRIVRSTLMGTGDCWTYLPTPRDAETVTTICFSVEYMRAMSVDRAVRR